MCALVVGARVLRNAEHALHAAGNTTDNAANSTADDSADRTGSTVAMMEAVLRTARNALGAGGCSQGQQGSGCCGEKGNRT